MPKKILFISAYPLSDSPYNHNQSALASFTKNTVDSLHKLHSDVEITILADKGDSAHNKKENNIRVERVWKKNSVFSLLSLLMHVLEKKDYNTVIFEIEWALFGKNPFFTLAIPILLFVFKIFGKKTYSVCHGVLLDFDKISGQQGIPSGSLSSKIYSQGMKLFYKFIITFSEKVIVLENYFVRLLNDFYHTDKVVFVPHGVDTNLSLIAYKEAKKRLSISSDCVLLCFGFLNWYKGSDRIITSFTKSAQKYPGNNSILIMGGGESRVHAKNRIYQKFSKSIHINAALMNRIRITGFISYEKIADYFSAADLVVLPYREFVSSSGPLSLAFSFGKPVILSLELKNYLESSDFSQSLKEAKLDISDIFFDVENMNMQRISDRIQDKIYMEKMSLFSRLMKEKRSWKKISLQYSHLLDL